MKFYPIQLKTCDFKEAINAECLKERMTFEIKIQIMALISDHHANPPNHRVNPLQTYNLQWDNWGTKGHKRGEETHQLLESQSSAVRMLVIPKTGGTTTIREPARSPSHSPGDGQHYFSRTCEQKGRGGGGGDDSVPYPVKPKSNNVIYPRYSHQLH